MRAALQPLLSRNRRFKGIHAGDTCYIFGNGASLKYMDLTPFGDHVGIGVNLICLHTQFAQLRVPYYMVADAYFMYPWFWSVYLKKYQPHIFGRLFKRAIARYPEVAVFTSASNVFGAGLRNRYYLHHCGHREVSGPLHDPCGPFSYMGGALSAALGLAIYMGFSKAILLGCDYLFTPISAGHYYSAGPPIRTDRYENLYVPLLDAVRPLIDLQVVTNEGESRWVPSITYTRLTGRANHYRENTELVAPDDLREVGRAFARGQYGLPIYPTT